jgi:aminocarboxymuconate-semialdehyde decarboxylase
MLRLVVDMLGADRVALGTDYPFPLGEETPGATIDAMTDLTPAVRASLRSSAARSFLGLA